MHYRAQFRFLPYAVPYINESGMYWIFATCWCRT